MGKNLRLIIKNVHDTGYVTATSEALPAAYSQRSARVKPWRSVGTDPQTLTTALPKAEYIDSVVIYRHNLTGSATARLRLFKSGVEVRDTGVVASSDIIPLGVFRFGVDPWGATTTGAVPIQQIAFWIPLTLADEYRITINDPTNPDNCLEIGRIIAGETFSPKFNPSYDLTLEWQEASEHRRTEGGSLRTVGDDSLARRLPIDLNWLDARDRRKLSDQLLRIGKRGDVYISVFPEKGGLDEAEYAFLGRRENDYSHTHNFYNNWKSQLVWIEV